MLSIKCLGWTLLWLVTLCSFDIKVKWVCRETGEVAKLHLPNLWGGNGG